MADGPAPPPTQLRRRQSDRRIQALRLKFRRWVAEPKSPFWPAALLAAISVACSLLLAGEQPVTPVLQTGDIATHTVWARTTYRLEDPALTAAKRTDAERATRPVYDFDPQVLSTAVAKLQAAFDEQQAEPKSAGDPAARAAKFAERAGIANAPTVTDLARARFDPDLGNAAVGVLRSLDGRRIVARADLVANDLETTGITERNVSGSTERVLRGTGAVMDLDAARGLLAERASLTSQSASRRELVVSIAALALRPNLTYNAAETEQRKKAAASAVNEVFTVIQKGRAVVEAGHEVTDDQARVLAAMHEQDRRPAASGPLAMLGLFLLSSSILGGVWAFGHRYMRNVPSGNRDLLVLGSLVLLGLALARIAHGIAGLTDPGAWLPPAALRFAVPSAATAIVAAVLLGADGAALVATATALLSGLALDGDLRETIYVFLGSITAAGALALPQKRSDLLKAGLAGAAAQLAMVGAFSLYDAGDPAAHPPFLPIALIAVVSGLVAGVLALGLVPIYEAFGYLTNFKLLELASLGSPLLKELSVQAPGTYHHSVVVGSLAEAAAETIGANPLFARVACYYHDIGKMKKPQYFIENRQSGEANLHDRLTPSMSALVVESHVKDGIEMGLANGLPKAIVDVIPQHHGTRLISFFYNKAKAQAEADPENAHEVVESDFRYPGPKPQTREAGIIMLADGVEASTRSITDPTPVRVHAMVQKVFSLIQSDGQLDECDLSLKDLAIIGATFEKVLLGMYHRRVAYPATADISAGGASVVQMPLPLTRASGPKGEE